MNARASFGDDGEDFVPESFARSSLSQASASLSNVTSDIIDSGIDTVLKKVQLPTETEHLIRGMLANDSNSAVARALYHSQLTKPTLSTLNVLGQTAITLPYRLANDKQMQLLKEYAPEFSIQTIQRESHDHPLAAACRLIDRKLVYSRVPPTLTVSDVGGSIIPLVLSGTLGDPIHSCSPVVDKKDPGREKLNSLRIRQISKDPHRKEGVRLAAKRFLDRDVAALCNKRVQDCDHKTPVITCIHVYDVPMSDWPTIMSNKGAGLVEGCLLFPRGVYNQVAGEIPYAGARYEVNVKENTFSMGFVGSSAWWYSHRLSEYLKYGVDQVLQHSSGTYSYKVVERRGDTIFFRLLRISNAPTVARKTVYRVPGVPMVKVNGFPVQRLGIGHVDRRLMGTKAKHARRCQHMFPAVLWQDMLGHAKDLAERGTLTYERLVNYYRTVAPRQSINGVIVAGGATVEDMNQIVALVVHVALFAFMSVAKTRAETEALTSIEMDDRARSKRSNFVEILAAMGRTLQTTLSLFVLPLTLCAEAMADKGTSMFLENGFDWVFEPVYREVSIKQLVPSLFSRVQDNNVVDDMLWLDAAVNSAPIAQVKDALASAKTASVVLNCLGDVLPEDFKTNLENKIKIESVNESEEREREEASKTLAKHDEHSVVDVASRQGLTNPPGSVKSIITSQEKDRRLASIREAIEEAEAEAEKSEAACADHYGRMMTGGSPNLKTISDWREQFGNPEYWEISEGTIIRSLTGLQPSDFIHSAMFVPHAFGGSRLLEVADVSYVGMSAGEMVKRVHKSVGMDFTGWGYTNDSLMVYNGPAIVESMKQSLVKPMDFEVVLMQGPPGCGKTTSIVKMAKPTDVILVPVRKAARETSERIAGKGKDFKAMADNRVKTVDSYLVNRLLNKKVSSLAADRLLADEAFMTREGRWLAVAALLGVSEVRAFGDKNQIPHVPRAESPSLHVMLRYQRMEETFVTYRCPAEVVACWNSVYNYKVRSQSKVLGKVEMLPTHMGLDVPKGCVMMGMYQADKKRLAEMYSSIMDDISIMTVHESQGNTYEHVRLHRFDLRKRVDNFSLYDRSNYVVVAMSRCTKTFQYIAPELDDLVSKWIKVGSNSQRVEACKDVKTAGQTIEFL